MKYINWSDEPSDHKLGVKGLHVVILGGSGAMGRECVHLAVEGGASAITFSYGQNKAVADEIAEWARSKGVKLYYAPLERRVEGASEAFFEEAVKATGQEIDAIIDTIGKSPNIRFQDQTAENWRETYDINLVGCFLSTRAIAERMRSKGVKGSIVLIASDNGETSYNPISAMYDSSKGGQITFGKNVAVEYAPDTIRANTVSPGWVDGEMNKDLPDDYYAAEMKRIGFGRFARPEEIASLCVYLAGRGASYISGANLPIHGAYR